jgi:hypothetical protein
MALMKHPVLRHWWVAALLVGACGKVDGNEGDPDATKPTPADAGPTDAAPADAALGSETRPAESCAALIDVLGPQSGVYWVKNPGGGLPLRVYCEQTIEGGGWALLYNSVRKDDGTTTAFWKIAYAERTTTKGEADPAQNYYQGELYAHGTRYMDIITDLDGKTVVAALVTAKDFNTDSMKFVEPVLDSGNQQIFDNQVKAGWSSYDADLDPYADTAGNPLNCAKSFSDVTQHYNTCWVYNLGSDADAPVLDGGVGPHVAIGTLNALQLAPQRTTGAGSYHQVKRIARFTRW